MEETLNQLQEVVNNPRKVHPLKYALKTFHKNPKFYITSFVWSIISTAFGLFFFFQLQAKYNSELSKSQNLSESLIKIQNENKNLKERDEYKINEALKADLTTTKNVFIDSLSTYENLLEISPNNKNLPKLKEQYAQVLKFLADNNHASASSALKTLEVDVKKELAASAVPSASGINVETLKVSSTPPGSGYSRQAVEAAGQKFVVDIVAAPLSSTRVIVDTASDSDCNDNCPVLSLSDYVARNGAFAGINGSYFCPVDYPSCAGKSNSFDTLLMNKNKVYFNSSNNVYSTVPAAIFGNGFMRFVGASQDWGRDTSVDGVLANQALLVSGGKSVFGGDGDPKKGSKGIRGFVATGNGNAYIGVVRNATVAEAALVLQNMGMDGALNLDSGGSSALWSGGYRVGPGRNIPNAILFVNR